MTTLTAYAAPVVSENGEHPVISAIDARHDHVYFQVVSGDGGSLIKPKRRADRGSARRVAASARRIWSATPPRSLADRWPADAPPPFKVDAQPAPDIAWVAWLGAAVGPETAPARPYYLRAPDAKPPKDPLRRRLAAIDLMMAWLSRLVERRHGRGRAGQPARRGAAGAIARRIVSPRLGRRRIRE